MNKVKKFYAGWIMCDWAKTIYVENLTTNLWQVNRTVIFSRKFSKLTDAQLVELILTETADCKDFYLDPQVANLDPRLIALTLSQELER